MFPLAMLCRGPAVASMGFHTSSESQPGDYFLITRPIAPHSY
jgi:hypothetical protein